MPVAINFWVEPTAKLAGEYGVTEIETNVAVAFVVDEWEQDAVPRIKAAINPTARQCVISRIGFLFILISPLLQLIINRHDFTVNHLNNNIGGCGNIGVMSRN